MSAENQWRRCSACKKPIPFGSVHWVCNVSTCNRARTALAFCSVSCWEVHLPVAKHRQAWAVEMTAPGRAQAAVGASLEGVEKATSGASAVEGREKRRILPATPVAASKPSVPHEVLIVASRLKEYVRLRSGFNTSERVLEPLSEIVRRVCDRAMENAEREGRKTLLERDIPVD